MPYSYGEFKNDVKQHLIDSVQPNTSFLDVGPGAGTYAHLLKGHFPNMDAIEIYPKYVEQFNLRSLYDNIIIGDILEFNFDDYEYLILGDVLEHFRYFEAKNLIDKICSKDKLCMVAVPYLFEQGEYDGNIHETHHQPDLTKELFLQRYPQMKFLIGDDRYGYFVNYEF
jgi:hypothetical protein